MTTPIKKVKDFKQLLLLVTQEEEGLEKFIYSRLRVGDVWWIPDEISRFGTGTREKHPWVVVAPYREDRPPVMACPRTTSQRNRKDELYSPANLLPELDKEGFIFRTFAQGLANAGM